MDQERPITQEEKLYLYPQSELVGWHAGFIGYLRASLGTDGTRFPTAWNDFDPRLKTPEFSRMLDRVILDRRAVGEMFRNRDSLRRAVEAHPEWVVNRDRGYSALRVDAGNYAFLFRLTPQADGHNLHCFCYLKKALASTSGRRGAASGSSIPAVRKGSAYRTVTPSASRMKPARSSNASAGMSMTTVWRLEETCTTSACSPNGWNALARRSFRCAPPCRNAATHMSGRKT